MTLFRRLTTSALAAGLLVAPPAPALAQELAESTPDAATEESASADASAAAEATDDPTEATEAPAGATDAPTEATTPTEDPTQPSEEAADPVLRPLAVTAPKPDVVAYGGGWGHSVGMSQYGAYAQALEGWSAAEILRHWYPGVSVVERAGTKTQSIRVNLSTTTTRGDVRAERGTVSWLVCTGTSGCEWMRNTNGDRIFQGPASGTWSVTVDKASGKYRIHAGDKLIWEGGDAFTYPRARFSINDDEDTVVAAVGGRYKWGFLELRSVPGACAAPSMCANLIVPSVEKYLYGLAEVPSSWHYEALKAQATVGRSYALRKIADFAGNRTGCLCDIYATPRDQAFAGYKKEEGELGRKWSAAVDISAGRIVTYGGAIAQTYYSSSHSRRTENVDDSWAFSTPLSTLPYLASVPDRWSDAPAVGNPYASWIAELGNRDFGKYVGAEFDVVTGIEVRSRTTGGTPRTILVRGYDAAGKRLERTFSGAASKGIVGAEMRQKFGLRSQQISRFGLEPFTDDDGSVHEYAIAALAHNGITSGCSATRFCPRDAINRAQIASLLAKALGLLPSSRNAFSDDDESIHEPYINAIADAGVTDGCGEGRYCPGASLTRAQMASLLVRAFDLPPSSTDRFSDDNGSIHEANINALAARGITLGRADGTFGPGGTVTRAEMATFLARALGLKV